MIEKIVREIGRATHKVVLFFEGETRDIGAVALLGFAFGISTGGLMSNDFVALKIIGGAIFVLATFLLFLVLTKGAMKVSEKVEDFFDDAVLEIRRRTRDGSEDPDNIVEPKDDAWTEGRRK